MGITQGMDRVTLRNQRQIGLATTISPQLPDIRDIKRMAQCYISLTLATAFFSTAR